MLFTLPPPACFMSGYAACEQRKAEVRFVSRTRCHSASVYSWIGLRMFVPALFTRMSRRPKRSRVALTSRATAVSSVTSTLTASAGAPSPSISATALRDLSTLRAATTMPAPAAARPRAIPSPIPPLPPVTTATRPLRSNTLGLPVRCKDYTRLGHLVFLATTPDDVQVVVLKWRSVASHFPLARAVHRHARSAPYLPTEGTSMIADVRLFRHGAPVGSRVGPHVWAFVL